MNLIEEAIKVYGRTGGKWHDDVASYATMGGYVHITPDYCLLGKPVRRDLGPPEGQWHIENPDAWFVKYAGGRGFVSHFINLIPFSLPFIGWGRETKGKPVRWFSMTQVTRRKEK